MLDVNLNNTEPKHVERINPQITVDTSGNIVWVPSLLDYDASVFHRGKTVTNKEFNTLFLRQLYQGNYLTDSLSKFLTEHLSTAIHRKFTNTYKLVKSYIKVFTSEDWIPGEDGYSYITITAEEHGFIPIEDPTGKGMNIDTELYLLSSDGRFYEVDQLTTDPDNTVQLYTDDTDVVGFVVIRSNERSYAMSGSSINAEDINGLMPIARTALYTDLIGIPDLSGIVENAEAINKIIDGTILIGKAQNANNVLDKIGNQAITDIFETGSTVVKQATNAKNYITGGNIESKFNELNTKIDNSVNTLNETINTKVSELTQAHEEAVDEINDNLRTLNNASANHDTRIAKLQQTLLYSFNTSWSTESYAGNTTITLTNGDKFSNYDYIDVYYYSSAYTGVLHHKRFRYNYDWDTYANLSIIDSTSFSDETGDNFLDIFNRTIQFKKGATQLYIGHGSRGYLKRVVEPGYAENSGQWQPQWVYEVNNMYCIPHSIYGGKFS